MQTLEQITRNGIHFVDSSGNLFPAMPSLSEQLVAQEFADLINSGALSVEDAYRNFWSYEEDVKLWGLPADREWRALLPDWVNIVKNIVPSLGKDAQMRLASMLKRIYQDARKHVNYQFLFDYQFLFEKEKELADCIRKGNLSEFSNWHERYSFPGLYRGVDDYDPNEFDGQNIEFFSDVFSPAPDRSAEGRGAFDPRADYGPQYLQYHLGIIQGFASKNDFLKSCKAIVESGDKSVVPSLIRTYRLCKGKNQIFRQLVYNTIVGIGGEEAVEFIDSLLRKSSCKDKLFTTLLYSRPEDWDGISNKLNRYLERALESNPSQHWGKAGLVRSVLAYIGGRNSIFTLLTVKELCQEENDSERSLTEGSYQRAIRDIHYRLKPKGLIAPEFREAA